MEFDVSLGIWIKLWGMDIGQPFNPYRLFTGIFIPNCLVKYKGISATAKLCWGRLAQYAGKDGAAFPSQETLAQEIGVNKRYCVRVLNLLEQKGFIKRVVPSGPDKWLHKTTHYLFLWHSVFREPSGQMAPSLSGHMDTQRDSIKKGDEFPDRVRSFEEFAEDRRSPDSSPGTEDHKRVKELGF